MKKLTLKLGGLLVLFVLTSAIYSYGCYKQNNYERINLLNQETLVHNAYCPGCYFFDTSDTDGDGIMNMYDYDVDDDGIPNVSDDDLDNNGIPNEEECNGIYGCPFIP